MGTRSAHEEGGNASATSRSAVQEIVPRWNVAEYKRLYLNTLNSRRFDAKFSDSRNFRLHDCMGVRRDTDIVNWNRR